ncbi:hypothetical protein HPA24_02945 [Streptococcus suis]|uniref:hypothetical protein n=1 Tax=Streptococcus suis TaxID=1307 RepID=UPI0005CF7F82|nr:hypothetical protein [Streptococcus suis]MCK3947426.1 hypothetical protein [Streptococcus suis]MCK3962518.1 hypothetical protein [Streptococcus suis]MCK3989701.1 hypothetical protein [Streptococcus suis]MCK4004466.1 hypothetical protein [Streptococcus suis]MDE1691904.1 hypothetical protein [Streptococcus suis]
MKKSNETKNNLKRTKFTRSLPLQVGLVGISLICLTLTSIIDYIPIGLQQYFHTTFTWGESVMIVHKVLVNICFVTILYPIYLWIREFIRHFRNGVSIETTLSAYIHLWKIRTINENGKILKLQSLGVCVDEDGIVYQFVIPIGPDYRKLLKRNKEYLEEEMKSYSPIFNYSPLTEDNNVWTMKGDRP